MSPDVADPADLSRSARFATFLREAVAIKTKRVLEVQKYPHVVWFADFPPDLPEVRSPLFSETWPEGDSAWLKVARVQEPARPAAPSECAPWLRDVDLDTPETIPALNLSYEDRDQRGDPIAVPVPPEVTGLWGRYLSTAWNPWAAKASTARRLRPFYQRLFSIREQLKDASDAFDLFVGVGLYESRVAPDQRFRRHLLAFPAELAMDPRTGLITLGPSPDFTFARVETDFMPTPDRTRLQPQIDAMQGDIESLGAGLEDKVAVGDVLKRMTTVVSAVAQYLPDLAPMDAPANGAVVSFGAALIVRPRSTRSLEALLEQIRKDASGDQTRYTQQDLPVPWRKMLEDAEVWGDRSRESEPRPGGRGGAEPAEVYFPLPSNDEQMRIVEKAEGTPGVVVQGPPGTGKSHTIANLISHYLAMGRRVLVTAQTAQALQVLRDKMPEDLRQLCVTLLGDSRASDRNLRQSVDGMLHRHQDFSPGAYERRIAGLEDSLVSSRTHLNTLDRTLQDARAAETEPFNPEIGYGGTRAAIARRLRAEREHYSWLKDDIAYGTSSPSYPSGWAALSAYHQALDTVMRDRLAPEAFTPPFSNDDARQAVQAVLNARKTLAANALSGASAPPPEATKSDLAAVNEWLTELDQLEGSATPDDGVWMTALRRLVLRNPAVWQVRKDECNSSLRPMTDDVVSATVKVDVKGRTVAEAHVALTRLEKHYSEGGARRTLMVVRPAAVKDNDWVEQAVTVEGASIQTPEEIARAKKALDGWRRLDTAWAPWSDWAPQRSGSPRAQIAALNARLKLLEGVLTTAGAAASLSAAVRQWLVQHFDADTTTVALRAAVAHRRSELVLADALARLDVVASTLKTAIGNRDVVPALRAMLNALLAEDIDGLSRAQDDLQKEIELRAAHKLYVDFIEAVRKAAPLLAAEIVATEGTTTFTDRFPVLADAWRHKGVQKWLDTILSKERIEATHRAAREERQRQQDLLAQITSAKAWLGALRRINDRQRATLTAWAQAVASIPASGKNVFRKRANAQRLLGGCLSSIPAWVVSLGRLYETVEPTPGLFDVAIIDEASQCWLDSLVLFYLAKQVIIVGDDKQISPTVVGVADSEMEALAKAYLMDFDFRSSFTLTSSLFDHGRRYLSDSVPLREHFRCVPEIITFSNRLCYPQQPLIPLRQVGSDRLEPLKRTYLPEGLRSGDINDVEARAIVDAIAACHDDPAYDDASFGVICLQGEKQGERIEQLLVERLGTEAYSLRHLRCGNPYVFQGDERDVMFMSMIVAPNQHFQSLTTAMYEQRFNVAMSRARDQAWLFHSVQEHELGPNCLRRRVLEYFRNPPVDTISGSLLDVPHLRLIAARAERSEERPPMPFDSWFEVDVALALAARGFRLSAQVQVATKSIDLVVEGDEGLRLAVECDGEAWHGADRYDEDVARQRQLERAGWRFVRVRESLFYSDEERAVREVMAACDELDIEPGGGSRQVAESAPLPTPVAARAPSFVVPTQTTLPGTVSVPLLDEDEEFDDEQEGLTVERDGGVRKDDEAEDDEAVAPAPSEGSGDYPDPKTAPAANIQAAVLDIVQRHGPLTKALIYEKYRDGSSSVMRAAKSLRHAVNSALSALERTGRVDHRDEGHKKLPGEVVFRLPAQAWVVPRATAPRDIDMVPLSELAAEVIRAGGHHMTHESERLIEVLKTIARKYHVRRFREQAHTRMWAAAELACDDERAARLGLR